MVIGKIFSKLKIIKFSKLYDQATVTASISLLKNYSKDQLRI